MSTVDDLTRMLARYGDDIVKEQAAKATSLLGALPRLSPDERAEMDERNRIAREEYAEQRRLRDLYPSYAWRRRRYEDE